MAAGKNLVTGRKRMSLAQGSDDTRGVVPDVILEVRSCQERWLDVLRKVAGYLNAGVGVVSVVDPGTRTAYVYSDTEAPRVLAQARGPREGR
jgi:Uma2 family endonuclease